MPVNPLEEEFGFPSPAPKQPAISGGVSFGPDQAKPQQSTSANPLESEFGLSAPPPPKPKPVGRPAIEVGYPMPMGVSKAEDIAKAATAQGILGLTADVPGAIGDIARMGESAYETALKYGVLKPAEKLGFMPKGKTAEDFMTAAKEVGKAGETPTEKALRVAEEEGRVSTIGGVPFPTSAGLAEAEKKYFPSLGYEGVSPEARSAGKAIRMGTSMLPGGGGVLPAAGRFTTGIIGSETGQLAQAGVEAAKERGYKGLEPFEPYIEPAAAIAGTVGSLMAGRGAFGARATAAQDISKFMREDIAAGRVDPANLQRVIDSGMPILDIFGPGTATREYAETMAGRAGTEGERAIKAYGETTGKTDTGFSVREPESQQFMRDYLENVNQGPINAAVLTQNMENIGQAIRNNIYGLARSHPNAGLIDASQFGNEIGKNTPFVENPLVSSAITAAERTAEGAPANWGIQVPQQVRMPNGQMTSVPGNLAFWDQVKRELDTQIDHAAPSAAGPGDKSRYASLKAAKDQLVNTLDNIVPAYATARQVALDTFRAESAPEAGLKFFKNMDAFTRNDAINAFNQMPQNQRELFKSGFLHAIDEKIGKKGGISSLSGELTNNRDFQEKARLALGQDYDHIRGQILFEDLRNKAKAVDPKRVPEGVLDRFGGAGLGALLPWAAEVVFQSQIVAPSHPILMGASATAGAAASFAKQQYTRNIANKAVSLMTSQNPRDAAELSRLMDSNPEFARMITGINSVIQSASQPRTKRETQRATGGRVMTAERMMSMAKRAKKEIESQTKALLEEPDEHIVKALKVANEHI